MMEARSYRWWTGVLILIAGVVLGAAQAASAFSAGQTSDQFANPALGCNNTNCHSGGTKPTVSLTGPLSVLPGSTSVYTLTINNPATQPKGGFNVAAPGGIFSTGGPDSAQTQTLANGSTGALEITHLGAKAALSGVTTFTFQWTAPNSFTSVTLTCWGNAVNFDHTNLGDAAGLSSLVVSSSVPSSTPSATASPSPTPTRTPTPTPMPSCSGDCNQDGMVTVDELVRAVNIALGNVASAQCPAADVNGDAQVTVDELVKAVNALLQGCL